MELILTVAQDPANANMLNHTKVFSSAGGVIGRAESSDWVLPDASRVVSSKHASISFQNGQFVLQDTSTNGTFVNGQKEPLGPSTPYQLKEGDVLSIGDYQLTVAVKMPKAEPIPTGLGSVDFLDNLDSTMVNTPPPKQQAEEKAQQLDSWLEPGSAAQPQREDWGTVQDSAPATPSTPSGLFEQPSITPSADPLDALSGKGVDASNPDPLAAFGNNEPAPFGGDDDDWWKEGSQGDNAPMHQHAIPTPSQAAPEPVTPQQPAAPQIPEPAPAQSAEHNPFAASNAGVSQVSVDSMFDLPPESTPQPPPAETSAPASQPWTSEPEPVSDLPQPKAGTAAILPSAPPPEPFTETVPAPTPQAQPQVAPQTAHAAQAQIPTPSAAPQPSAESVSQGAVGVTADARHLAELLGLSQLQEQELAKLLPGSAEIIKETVTRLLELMKARSAIKNELRVERTVIQTADNNPLKFSGTPEDALKTMFGTEHAAFMGPLEAVNASFNDIADHQVAVLQGMRSAFEAMLKEFDPTRLADKFTPPTGASGLLANKNAKRWEAFEEYFSRLQADPENAYKRLFGEAFANAYESQIANLKYSRSQGRN